MLIYHGEKLLWTMEQSNASLNDGRLGGSVGGGDVEARGVLVVARVGVCAALDEEADGVEGGELADRVAAHRARVPRARQVQQRAAVLAARVQPQELVHRLRELKRHDRT